VRLLFFALLLAVGSGLGACAGRPSYVLDPTHDETVKNKLDAQWFTRDIFDGKGLAAVELTYCPLQPNTATVCRTAIVWRRGSSLIMDLDPKSEAQPTAAAPPPPAPPPATP
jgi:hypothetical protein